MESKSRGRGRPRLVKTSDHPVLGIIDEPYSVHPEDPNLSNIMELLYDNPTMFNKIFKLLKKYNVDIVRFKFTHDNVYIYAQDHIQKNIIYVKIIGEKINRYYCAEPFDIAVRVIKVHDIMRYINNSHEYILFESNTYNKLSRVSLSLRNKDMGSQSIDVIELENLEEDLFDEIQDILREEEHYPIRFEVIHKLWKNDVNKWISNSNQIVKMEKIGFEPIRFRLNHKDGRGDHKTEYTDHALINISSTVEEFDVFSVDINLNYIKVYANQLISNTIEIATHMEKPIIFTSRLDYEELTNKKYKKDSERCVVKVITLQDQDNY